uniref:Ac45-VOA1_TM domain-containing protein n=1 Tax=Panagrellus redivivus TaxID=6233 RepID=A0A7E4VHI9_PANRE
MRMFLLAVAVALALTRATCEDAVLWSNNVDVSASSASELVAGESVVILALDDFNLASFSKAAHAYSSNPADQQDSSVIAAIRAAKYHASEDVSSLPEAASATVIKASNWDQLNEQFSALNLKSGYTGILVDAATLELTRVKRVADDVDFDPNDEAPKPKKLAASPSPSSAPGGVTLKNGGDTPVIVPRWGGGEDFKIDGSAGSCLLYFENITIVVLSKKSIGGSQKAHIVPLGLNKDTYQYNYDCEKKADFNVSKPFVFTVAYTTTAEYKAHGEKPDSLTIAPQTFTVSLTFNVTDGFLLANATLNGLKVTAGTDKDVLPSDASVDGSAIHPSAVPLRAYYGHNFACGRTQAIFFNATLSDVYIGLVFDNIQIQGSGIKATKDGETPQFTRITADCVGTFSSGSWMGIIVAITLASVLMFGFLMLNSVQTMDRFDDPKQKQIVINFKE